MINSISRSRSGSDHDLSDLSPLVVRSKMSPSDFDGLPLSPLLLIGVHDEGQEPRFAVALLSLPLVPVTRCPTQPR